MKKILNGMFLVLKLLLLLLSFGLTLYIILTMYKRINKSMIESIDIFLPFLFLVIIFMFNIIKKQKQVNLNLFYNLTCCLVFSVTILVSLRAIFDKNMLLNSIMGYNIDFNYFSDYISFMKVMMYGLFIGNIFFMAQVKENKKTNLIEKEEEKPIAKKVDIEVL